MNQYLSYEEFGRRFYEITVTEERVGGAIAAIAATSSKWVLGQVRQDREVHREVGVQEPRVTRSTGELITFAIRFRSRSTWSSTCG